MQDTVETVVITKCPELDLWEKWTAAVPLALATAMFLFSFVVPDPELLRTYALLLIALAQVWVGACLRNKCGFVFSKTLGSFPGIVCSVAAFAAIAWWLTTQMPITLPSFTLLVSLLNPIFLIYGVLQLLESAGVLSPDSE